MAETLSGILRKRTERLNKRPVEGVSSLSPEFRKYIESLDRTSLTSPPRETRSQTRQPGAMGRDVNKAAIDEVLSVLPGKNPVMARKLMEYTANQESRFGTDPRTHEFRRVPEGTVGHGGTFQVTDGAFKDIQRRNDPVMAEAKQRIRERLGVDIDSVPPEKIREFLSVPLHSALAGRLHYFKQQALPKNEKEIPKFYVERYKRGG